MTTREYNRLLDLLAKLHEESAWDGQLRDAISFIRQAVWDLVEA